MAKYKISLSDLDKEGGAKRLEADGFKKQDIIDAVHRETDNGLNSDRTKQRQLIDRFYDREKG